MHAVRQSRRDTDPFTEHGPSPVHETGGDLFSCQGQFSSEPVTYIRERAAIVHVERRDDTIEDRLDDAR